MASRTKKKKATTARAAGGTEPAVAETPARRLRASMNELIRVVGILISNEMPAGQGLSISHAHALLVLLEHRRKKRVTSQIELAGILAIDKSNVTRLCVRMEEIGHLVQTRAPHDGRSRLLDLTDAGVKVARKLDQASERRFDAVLGSVAKSRRTALFTALDDLSGAVSALDEDRARLRAPSTPE